jgi:hypothetical protein
VGQEGQSLGYSRGKSHFFKIGYSQVCVLHNVVEECHGATDLVGHLLCQVEGMKNVGKPCLVGLISVGVKAELERHFYAVLHELSLPVTVESNRNER